MYRSLQIILALLCALGMSQFPEFHQQYKQRLGGALDESNRHLTALDTRASAHDMDRFDYIRDLLNSEDKVVRSQGDAMVHTLIRHQWLQSAIDRFNETPWYMIAIETAFHLDLEIAQNTARQFVPAIPLSISGGAHAFCGFIFGFLLIGLLRRLVFRKAVA